MPRGVRKVTLYVCTLDGSIHADAATAKARARDLRAVRAKVPLKRRSSHGGQTLRILELLVVRAMAPREIRLKLARSVPPQNVAPTLNRLVKQGLVRSSNGIYSVTAKGKKRVDSLK